MVGGGGRCPGEEVSCTANVLHCEPRVASRTDDVRAYGAESRAGGRCA